MRGILRLFVVFVFLVSGCGGKSIRELDADIVVDSGSDEDSGTVETPYCGDGIIGMGEVCDGADLNGITCGDIHGFNSGTLRCKQDCSGYDVSDCVPGDLIHADSCLREDVQAAIDGAESGDVVEVSAGECTWDSGVAVNMKNLTVKGAGIDSTVITMSPSGPAFGMGSTGSRITGFTVKEGGVVVTGGDYWRVDHCKFIREDSFGAALNIRLSSSSYLYSGVVDNCSFFNTRVLASGAAAMLYEGDTQHKLWSLPLDLGTSKNVVYVEDSEFEADRHANAVDGNYGGAYVFRFNRLSGIYIEAHSVQGNNRALRRWEIYGNTIDNPGGSIYYPYRIRGGTGVVFNDTVMGTWTNYGIALDNVRSYEARGEGGKCDGTSLWDGNEDETGYPCRDQIGRGPDNPQWIHEPPGVYTQPLVPAYSWGNRRQDNNNYVGFQVINSSGEHIKEDRDFYNEESSFDGTSGVGSGPISVRPLSCTPGVAYWAEDEGDWNKNETPMQGVLYKCVAENRWELYYIPYVYPHPLRLENR